MVVQGPGGGFDFVVEGRREDGARSENAGKCIGCSARWITWPGLPRSGRVAIDIGVIG